MRVRYGSELKRLRFERNLLFWAFILLTVLTLLLIWQYEQRIDQLERLHHAVNPGMTPARGFGLLSPAQGTFSVSERSGVKQNPRRACTEGSALARTDASRA